MHMHMELLY